MTTQDDRRSRIRELDGEARRLWTQRSAVIAERDALELEQMLEDINSKMGIFDMREQEIRGRSVVGYRSLVSESLTAAKSCPACGGTGKPMTRKT